MQTYGLGKWIDRKFGFRDEHLVTADELPVNLGVQRLNLEREYAQCERELEELSDEYQDLIKQGAEKSESERDSIVKRAEKTKRQYEQSEQQLHATGVRVTTLLVIQALREETKDGIPSPEDAELAIKDTYEASDLPSRSFDEYVAIVAKVTEITDLFSWLDYSEPRIWDDPVEPTPPEPMDDDIIDEL